MQRELRERSADLLEGVSPSRALWGIFGYLSLSAALSDSDKLPAGKYDSRVAVVFGVVCCRRISPAYLLCTI
jgi:hypothetical protein